MGFGIGFNKMSDLIVVGIGIGVLYLFMTKGPSMFAGLGQSATNITGGVIGAVDNYVV